jgi:hypothetical protein
MKKHKEEVKRPPKILSTTLKPFLLKDGDDIIYKGTRSNCMTKLSKTDGKDLEVVENPRFKRIK